MIFIPVSQAQENNIIYGVSIRYEGKKGKGKVHPCTGTEALYRPYGP